ncbi:AAA family ATPase [uncultured Tateyamaria sp.]|uniref:AAA family ATPase n=1 Tax=uncultured Tateyamaria sp. TaxID=455651 RepID=UPI002637FF2F|nr:AAA family ATPase [uncultured Tateyamaria sp.]
MNRRILISGCSSGGKSTLLEELGKRGFATVPEPGRRIVAEEKAGVGAALPWFNPEAFARRAMEMARSDLIMAERETGLIFFDRGLVDAAVGLQTASGSCVRDTIGTHRHYDRTVFLAPPWPEIFVQDEDRRHGIKAAVQEFEQLNSSLQDLGYEVVMLPKVTVQERADFVLQRVGGE